jgi:hypothetical protein
VHGGAEEEFSGGVEGEAGDDVLAEDFMHEVVDFTTEKGQTWKSKGRPSRSRSLI